MIRRSLSYLRGSSGAKAAGLLSIGAGANLLGSWAYNIVCIRWLGSRQFGDVAALTAVTTIVFLPLIGVQSSLAREVARLQAAGDSQGLAAILRYTTRRLAVAGVVVLVVLVCLSPLAERALNLQSVYSAVVTAILIGVGLVWVVLQGALQGLQRFARLAVVLGSYGLARPVLAIPFVLAGFGAAGAMGAAAVAIAFALIVVAIPLWPLAVRTPTDEPRTTPRFDAFSTVVLGLVAYTLLINLDLIVAKISLSSQEAGTYSSAALIGKLAAQVPAATVGTILLPRAIALIRRGESVVPLILRALVATLGFGMVLTAVLAVIPQAVVTESFGTDFSGARDLLAPAAAAMLLSGVLNIHLMFAVAAHDRAFIRLIACAALGEIAVFAFLHDSPRQIIAATAVTPALALLYHELRSPNATWRMLRSHPARASA